MVGKKKKIKLADFIRLATTLQIPEKAYLNSFKNFHSKNEKVKELINKSFLSSTAKRAYWQIWQKKQAIFQS